MPSNDAHDRFLAEQLRDPAFRAEYELSKRGIEAFDASVNAAHYPQASRDQPPIGGTSNP